jgi:hypothetical protein
MRSGSTHQLGSGAVALAAIAGRGVDEETHGSAVPRDVHETDEEPIRGVSHDHSKV